MRRQEDQLARVRRLGHLVEALERVHLAMPQRILVSLCGFGQYQRQIGLAQDAAPNTLLPSATPSRERSMSSSMTVSRRSASWVCLMSRSPAWSRI